MYVLHLPPYRLKPLIRESTPVPIFMININSLFFLLSRFGKTNTRLILFCLYYILTFCCKTFLPMQAFRKRLIATPMIYIIRANSKSL
ncbi:hypothetical protein BDF21DRAFT_433821 [Thamnidium elegans]|nr:hypothetical protein BDF21DRAFT_433821 [Thamnidium elegans]